MNKPDRIKFILIHCSSTNSIDLAVNITTTNSMICVGQTATLNVNGASTYSWSTSATTSSIAVSPSVNTTYSVTRTDANNCSNLTLITQSVSIFARIVETSLKKAISVYPHPVNSEVTVRFTGYSSPLKLEISNVMGEVIFTEGQLQGENTTISLSEFSKGICFIRTYSDGERENTILIVQ